jgi:type VI secretion system protein VasG
VRVLDEAVRDAVALSARYLSDRRLPDKAIGVLDTACAKVALGQAAMPAAIEERVRLSERLAAEIGALERESAAGADHHKRLAELRQQRSTAENELAALSGRYEQEKQLVGEVFALRQRIDALTTAAASAATPAAPPAAAPAKASKKSAKDAAPAPVALSPEHVELLSQLRAKSAELAALQGQSPLVPMQVDGLVVAEIVAAWTGIPLGKMVKDEIATVMNLRGVLEERVLGQTQAIDAVAQRVRTARANLEDPNKPKGVFLFVGPSGVGKTETALALAESLYGGERKLITINMSEYQEAHSVSGLKGSPPGYVGYGEGGVLTEAVRRNPYSVVLLDEVEKAHPDVLEMFFQVFDKGVMDDAEGREIDFRNTLIILTSNIGSSQIMQACLNKAADELPGAEALAEALRPVLYKQFKPAFLGRLKVVPYYPIPDEILVRIIELKLSRVGARVRSNHLASFEYDRKLVEAVLARCTEVDSGARNVDHILTGTLLPQIAEQVLGRMAEGAPIERIKVSAAKNGDFRYTVQ